MAHGMGCDARVVELRVLQGRGEWFVEHGVVRFTDAIVNDVLAQGRLFELFQDLKGSPVERNGAGLPALGIGRRHREEFPPEIHILPFQEQGFRLNAHAGVNGNNE
jgi:hypothetical protein